MRASKLSLLVAALTTALAGGCTRTVSTSPGPVSAAKSVEEIGPCPMRLHDISGELLMFHLQHGRLPASLEELSNDPAGKGVPLVCPVSNLPYVYDAAGYEMPGRRGRLILWDAETCHAGLRWGIVTEPPRNNMPNLSLRVARVTPDVKLPAAGTTTTGPAASTRPALETSDASVGP